MTLASRSRHTTWLMCIAVLAALCAAGATAAGAQAAGPQWVISSVASPTNFSTEQNELCAEEEVCDEYVVTATNVGTEASKGVIKLTDQLPPGMLTTAHRGERHNEFPLNEGGEVLPCTPPSPTAEFTCEETEPVGPGGIIQIFISVRLVAGTEPTALNHVELEEAGSAQGSVSTSEPSTMPNTVNGEEPLFGPQDFSVGVYGGNKFGQDTIAGDHPSTLTVNIHYKSKPNAVGGGEAVQEPKSTIVDLPLGFVGNTLAAAQCPESTLYGKGQPRQCPPASEVGVVALQNQQENQRYRIYNTVPEAGYPATFAFEIAETNVLMPARVVPSAEGYMLSVAVPAIPRSKVVKINGFALTFFGTPGAQNGTGSQAALFSNPVDCSAKPLEAKLETDSWVDPERWVIAEAPVFEADPEHAVTGCESLQFDPSLESNVEGGADSPAALNLHVGIPQAPFVESVLATPDLRGLEVELPEGFSLSPSAANGLAVCPATGPEGIELGNQDGPSHEAHSGEVLGEDGVPHATPGHCPAASQIGTLEATTPVLGTPLTGHLYLAEPECGTATNPAPCSEADVEDGRAFRLYAELAGAGVIVKLPGVATANAATGRLTTRFSENPQFPLGDLKVHVSGGPSAPLATPQTCGTQALLGTFTPWSAPGSGGPVQVASPLTVGGCGPTVFAPNVIAQAGQTGALQNPSFTFRLTRQDGEPYVTGTTVKLPPGLLANVGSVTRCSSAAAAAASCPADSAIGSVQTAIGPGSAPFQTAGTVYLTDAYAGGPFGLAIVVPTKAGPFTLAGNTGRGEELVRAAIQIDPNTAAVSIKSDPIPQVVDGVPLRLRSLTVSVDRTNFMVNPSNCKQQQIQATVEGAGGVAETVNRPFAVIGCKGLAFNPGFKVSTAAKTSKANGASLKVDLTYPQSGEANIHSVHVELPKALPSRLTTLQKACAEREFNTNPATCPAASIVGHAKAITPILSVPLEGPAYFVSHGGAAFPELIMVLQGDGVVIQLNGETFINSKTGITSSTFATVPDAPVSSFELTLPEESNSVFAANGNLCDQKLIMPTSIVGQNGAQVKQSTRIEVEGCGKTLSVVSTRVTKKTLKLSVYAPTAGKVTASGNGVSSGSKSYSGQEAQTFTLTQKKAGKLKTKIKLTFTPGKGKDRTKQTKTLAVKLKK